MFFAEMMLTDLRVTDNPAPSMVDNVIALVLTLSLEMHR